jgi:hypothetical protein
MRVLFLALAIVGIAVTSATAQVPNFNDCRNQARSRALTQEQRRQFMHTCMAQIRAACAQHVRQRQVRGDARHQMMRSCQGIP